MKLPKAKKLITKTATSQNSARSVMLFRMLASKECADPCRNDGWHREHTEHHDPKRQEIARPLGEQHPGELTNKRSDPPSPRPARLNKTEHGRYDADHRNANEEIPLGIPRLSPARGVGDDNPHQNPSHGSQSVKPIFLLHGQSILISTLLSHYAGAGQQQTQNNLRQLTLRNATLLAVGGSSSAMPSRATSPTASSLVNGFPRAVNWFLKPFFSFGLPVASPHTI